jgi:hypothetical protein
MEKQPRTFLSYSRANKDFAVRLAKELKSEGSFVWLDQLDIPVGARWDDEVHKALVECEIFLIIMTPASVASENVKDEIGYAIDNHKRIMPVLLENCEIPFRLRRLQYVDFTKKSFDNGVEAVKDLLRSLIAAPTSPLEKKEDQLAAQKAKEDAQEERLAQTKRKAQEEADRIAAQKAEAERLTKANTEAKRQWKEEADWLAAEKAKKERAAKAKDEARQEADRRAAQEAEKERRARAKIANDRSQTQGEADPRSALEAQFSDLFSQTFGHVPDETKTPIPQKASDLYPKWKDKWKWVGGMIVVGLLIVGFTPFEWTGYVYIVTFGVLLLIIGFSLIFV